MLDFKKNNFFLTSNIKGLTKNILFLANWSLSETLNIEKNFLLKLKIVNIYLLVFKKI